MKPLVSIITVVFNGEEYIERTIESVLLQTYKNVEYIIIDGNSTDGTVKKINLYKDRITKFVSEADTGIYDAINKGISIARGELIGLVHAGDWYERDAIEKLVSVYNLKKDDEGVIITGNHTSCTYEGRSVSRIQPHQDYRKMIYYTLPISHCATIVSKSIYDKYGKYNTKYKSSADMDFFLRIFNNYGIAPIYINENIINIMPADTSYSLKGILETSSISLKYNAPYISVFLYLVYKLFQQFVYNYLSFKIIKKIYYLANNRHIKVSTNDKHN